MKKVILAAIIIAACSVHIKAQNPDDALRYSQQFYTGTARFSAMGGAFTALGGDISSFALNPAGAGVFRRSEFSISPHIGFINTRTYFTSEAEESVYNFNLGQFGVVVPMIQSGKETGLVSLNFGYSYNVNNNYTTNAIIRGTNATSSMTDYWASISEGTRFSDLSGASGMAFDAWLMDTINGGGGMQYATVFSRYGESNSTYGQSVRRLITNEGFSGDHSFTIGANFDNKLFAGATLGMARFNYTGHYEHVENDPNNVIFDFNSFSYIDHYEASSTGYSFKAGIIYLPVEFLRIGLAFHSPTIYRVSEYYYEDLTSSFDDGDSYEFSSDAFRFNYRLTTPYRLLGGVAVQLMKVATLSVDYEMVDYGMTRFSKASDGYQYYDENESIKDIFRQGHNIRAGAEYRLGGLYFRGGYGYYGTAFNSAEVNSDNYHTSLSGGIGFRQTSFYIDLAYTRMTNPMKYYMYNYYNVDPVTIETTRNTVIATLGLRF